MGLLIDSQRLLNVSRSDQSSRKIEVLKLSFLYSDGKIMTNKHVCTLIPNLEDYENENGGSSPLASRKLTANEHLRQNHSFLMELFSLCCDVEESYFVAAAFNGFRLLMDLCGVRFVIRCYDLQARSRYRNYCGTRSESFLPPLLWTCCLHASSFGGYRGRVTSHLILFAFCSCPALPSLD